MKKIIWVVGSIVSCAIVAFLLWRVIDTKNIEANYFSANIQEVRAAYKKNAEAINKCNEDGVSPLMFAAIKNQTDSIKFLLEHGADPNKELDLDWTVLGVVISKENIKAIKLLLEHGVDVNQKFIVSLKDGRVFIQTPLMLAINYKNNRIIKLLLESGADVNVTGKSFLKDGSPHTENISPLLVALDSNDLSIIKTLINAGADVNINAISYEFAPMKELISPLMMAIESKNFEIVKYLVEHGADVSLKASEDMISNTPSVTPVIVAIKHENMEMLKYLVEQRATLEGANAWALAFSRNWEIIEYLSQVTSDDYTKTLKQVLMLQHAHMNLFASAARAFAKTEKELERLAGTNLFDAINLWSIFMLIPEESRKSEVFGTKVSDKDLQNALAYTVSELNYRNALWVESSHEGQQKICDYFALKTGAKDSSMICGLFIEPLVKYMVTRPYVFPE